MRRLLTLLAADRRRALASAVVLVAVAGACLWLGLRAADDDRLPLDRVFKEYQEYLLGLPGVKAVGIGERHGNRFIQLFVRDLEDDTTALLPKKFAGWPVGIQEVKDADPTPKSPSPSPSELPSPLPPAAVTADVRGTVVSVTRLGDADDGTLGSLLVMGDGAPGTRCAAASVSIDASTAFYRLEDEELRPLSVATLDDGWRDSMVEVEFSGAVTRGDPWTAHAAVVVFLDAAP